MDKYSYIIEASNEDGTKITFKGTYYAEDFKSLWDELEKLFPSIKEYDNCTVMLQQEQESVAQRILGWFK